MFYHRLLRRLRRSVLDRIDLGDLRRTRPVSKVWGFDRGTPVDRVFMESFLGDHAEDIRGTALEIGDDVYTRRFGGTAVERCEVLHAAEGNPKATWVADLATADAVPTGRFDVIVCTQTLQIVPEIGATVDHLYRMLKPAGVLLVTVPGISKVYHDEHSDRWQDFWHLNPRSLRWLLERKFPADRVEARSFGNVLTATAFLHGLAAEELEARELDEHDPDFPVLVAGRAVKPEDGDADSGV